MTDPDKSTIAELAEVIADQNERTRELHQQLDEQNDVIIAYELDQEESEKVDAALYADLTGVIETARAGGLDGPVSVADEFEAVLDRYFGEDYE